MYHKLHQRVGSSARHRLTARKVLYAAGIFLALLVSVQMVLPSDYILPRSNIGSRPVGLTNRGELQKELAAAASTLELELDGRAEVVPASLAGIRTDVEATIAKLPKLSVTDRLIPFKPVYLAYKDKTVQPVRTVDKQAVHAFAEATHKRLKKDPVNATAAILEGQLRITGDKSGAVFPVAEIERALLAGNTVTDERIQIKSDKIPASTKKKDLEPLAQEYNLKSAAVLTVKYGDTTKSINPEDLKKWLTVSEDPATGKRLLRFDPKVTEAQIQSWAKEYNTAPGTTQIAYVDDVEVSRSVGSAGRALPVEAIQQQLGKWLEAPSADAVVLASSVLEPKVVATRTYSRSSAELQAKLEAWIKSHSGRYQVAIRELNGRGREASYRVAQQTVMASTYKTFLAFAAYLQAENGALNLSAPLTKGKTIEQCIEVMITNSDNDCAIKLGQSIGWAKADQIIAAAGFEAIVLNNYDAAGRLKGDKLVNANQQAKFLAQLSGGSLINSDHTNRLLGYMKRQTYRDGIPAGSRGAAVADKVGFLGAYIHDVGIVYGPKSTYSLVIMSEGSSWSNIKDLAGAVYDFMQG